MTIRAKYCTGGEVRQRYVFRHPRQDRYVWREQGYDGYDVAQGTCDAEDLPPAIKAACDAQRGKAYLGHHYACVWPLPLNATHNKPLAAPGLLSYRYPNCYVSWIMIGARNDAEALIEAERSLQFGACDHERLERWDGTRYVKAQEFEK